MAGFYHIRANGSWLTSYELVRQCKPHCYIVEIERKPSMARLTTAQREIIE